MTPRERYLSALRGKKTDRVPLDLAGFACANREALAKIQDPLRRKVAERVFEAVAYSVGVRTDLNRFMQTPPARIRRTETKLASGNTLIEGVIDTPKGKLTYVEEWDPRAGTTWVAKRPCETREEIEKLASVPWELPEEIRPPAAECFAGDFARRGFVRATVSSPLVCVSHAIGFEDFLALTATDREWVLELVEICRKRALACLDAALKGPGIDVVWMGGSEWVTPPMGSPELYDALVQEQEREIIRRVHAYGAVVHLHCHGRVRRALERMIERECDYTEPVEAPPDGDVTMAEAKGIAAGRITLGGNIECRVLANEDESAVERAVRAAFEGGKDRFVLRPTEGPSPVLSDREFRNWMRVVDVWEELSPISPSPSGRGQG